MKTHSVILILALVVGSFSFVLHDDTEYRLLFDSSIEKFRQDQRHLQALIRSADLADPGARQKLIDRVHQNRLQLKRLDFWLRYFEPIAYRKINGPLPVEWETEVFEKFEPPYRREGAGLTLAEEALEEENPDRHQLDSLIAASISILPTYEADSIRSQLSYYHHFFLANRLFLLNLGAIYTTGFECPDTSRIIPELRDMMAGVKQIYLDFNAGFTESPLSREYLDLYDQTLHFVNQQPDDFSAFDHFRFLRDYVNTLYKLNQGFIQQYHVRTINFGDYTLSNSCPSIFDKSLYSTLNTKGIFSLVDDPGVLSEIRRIGKLLFYDPILSANNKRSCASCHKPDQYFADTTQATPLVFGESGHLPRNAPALVNAVFNHLVMLDGRLISLQEQARDVIQNPEEINGHEKEILRKIQSCKEYRNAFRKLVKYTPEEKELSLNHIVSAITFYYTDFGHFDSPFDRAMNRRESVGPDVQAGFNLFMSKAQCGTCHFVPEFNGIKPPYVGSEFEVLGVPADSNYSRLSDDKGRYSVIPHPEMRGAFRTATIRNIEHTKPYMHNGVFWNLDQVIDFYDAGGGVGKKLVLDNQTLATDSLKLSAPEKNELKAFMHALNENIIFESPPAALPVSSDPALNHRKVGGEY